MAGIVLKGIPLEGMVCQEKMEGTRGYHGWGRDSGSGGEAQPKLGPRP